MDQVNDTSLLFGIIKQVKQFYEVPIIYITKRDISDAVFKTMCGIREAVQDGSKDRVIDAIVDLHIEWLRVIDEIEVFKNDMHNIYPKDILQCVSFTIDAMSNRLKYFKKYTESNRASLSNMDQADLISEIEIVEAMHKETNEALLEKKICYGNFTGVEEFQIKLRESTDELLNWVDKIYDGFAIELSNHLNFNVPHLVSDLTKSLQQIIDDIQTCRVPSAQKLLDELKEKGKELASMIRCTAGHDVEISKIIEKIQVLDERIKRLENEPTSAAVMALTHKKEYLVKRLSSLENLKTTLKTLNRSAEISIENVDEEELCICEDFYRLRIFNHALPQTERERLVTELCYFWDVAVFGEHTRKSIISILSAADVKEEFTDELGNYYVDEYSRKIYKISGDSTLYQPNENNELVPLSDNKEHVFFYDECGRYFLDPQTRERIYKAHENASEYIMDSTGVLLKTKEERDGVTYYYDTCGRYYVNDDGKQIYRDEDAMSEYENDGLGNLVRIRSQAEMFTLCPEDAHITEDSKYLKQTVGHALRVCIANIVSLQPADPIKCLSSLLINYRKNVEMRETQARENEELNIEREIYIAEQRAAAERAAAEAALLTRGASEASYDSNLLNYTALNPTDASRDTSTN